MMSHSQSGAGCVAGIAGSHRDGVVNERPCYEDVRLIFATSLSIAGQRLADVNTGSLLADVVRICWISSGVSSH